MGTSFLPGTREHAVLGLVREHVTPLQARLRGALVDELARRLIALEPAGGAYSEPQQLALLALRTGHVIHAHEEELGTLDRRWSAFSERWFARSGERERRDLLVDYLTETARDPLSRRADLRALKRDLDHDALRERHVLARHAILAALEIAVTFIGRACAAALTHRLAVTSELMSELFSGGKTDDLLRARGEKAPRWQIRHAAWDALARILKAVRASGSTEAFEARNLGAAVRRATSRDEHPWVQGAALEVILRLSPRFAEPILSARLLELPADLPPRDFLVRRQIVDLLAGDGDEKAHALIHRVLAQRDPSEHVRLGLCAAVARSRAPAAPRSLRIPAGLDPAVPEPSPRVRAAAAAAARAAIAAAPVEQRPDRVSAAVEILCGMLGREEHALPLAAACEEAGALALELGALARGDGGEVARRLLRDAGPRLLASLLELSSRSGRPPRVHEAAAGAAEQVSRALDPERDAWTTYLAAVAAEIRPGRSRTLDLARLPAGLPPLPDDPVWLGRILAELTRGDWGLAASRRGGRLALWRGDHFRRRLWRVLHELRHPMPNKRQAFAHTVGRAPRGELRAPPGGLDEVTETLVPGERVVVEEEGTWARHLPAVDDLLHLPVWEPRAIQIFSSQGVTTIEPPPALWARLANRLRLSLRYGELAHARLQSLRGAEPHERQRFTAEVGRELGIRQSFTRYPYGTMTAVAPAHLQALFGAPPAGEEAQGDSAPVGKALAALSPVTDAWHQVKDWLDLHGYYFLSPIQNSQAALALFAGGFVTFFLAEAAWKRRRIDRARARIPLTIGGWGTRGKSGTERLKAALFHGLGYEVLVKTTGCEAMIIHAVPDEPARELFIFRSYDKATIWEMRDTLELAAALGCEVYLWECMALTPRYVELLQRDWMRDDIVTLTNAYPDHEDTQGPAGINVAECVTSFIPDAATCVTSEVNFLPLFADAARERGTRLLSVGTRAAELIAEDLLALFPYKEHPRNIALVARLAEELGIDASLAIATMAEHVVPDIGVLKVYPPARVRGRVLSFANGMSANERTGFLNNWRRTGMHTIDPGTEPERMVVTVVNNRADRVTRSEVFARILVEDAAADVHVLIGTNLSGLTSYLHAELHRHVAELEVVVPEDLRAASATQPFVRLGRHLGRLRVPHPDLPQVLRRLEIYAAGVGLEVIAERRHNVEDEVRRIFSGGPLAVAAVRAEIAADELLWAAVDGALRPARARQDELVEVSASPSRDDLTVHFGAQLARLAVHARLRARLEDELSSGRPDLDGFHAAFRAAYRELFLDSLVVVANPGEKGDAVIDRCARACPPGTTVSLMGIQNIKGTGLDFVYRWLALDHVTALTAEIASGNPERRLRALRALESFEDHGMLDAGAAAAALAAIPTAGLSGADLAYIRKVQAKVTRVHQARLAALGVSRATDLVGRMLERAERWLDPLDSIRRRSHAGQVMRDLVARRISHARAAVEMRKLYDRQKGGWLAEALRGRK